MAAFKIIKRLIPRGLDQLSTFTDNKVANFRLMNPTWRLSRDSIYLYEELMTEWSCLGPGTGLEIFWCPGHSGIRGKDLVDEVAGLMAVGSSARPEG